MHTYSYSRLLQLQVNCLVALLASLATQPFAFAPVLDVTCKRGSWLTLAIDEVGEIPLSFGQERVSLW